MQNHYDSARHCRAVQPRSFRRVYRFFDATPDRPHSEPDKPVKLQRTTHAVLRSVPYAFGGLWPKMSHQSIYIKIKSYEKATLHSRNSSFQSLQHRRVRGSGIQYPSGIQRRKTTEERGFRIHDRPGGFIWNFTNGCTLPNTRSTAAMSWGACACT